MTRNILLTTLVTVCCLSLVWVFKPSQEGPAYISRDGKTSTSNAGIAFSPDYFRQNVNTGKVEPQDRLEAKHAIQSRASRAGSLSLTWVSRGPDNVGGRTRGMVELIGYPDTLIAGSVSGGLFYSYNGGGRWEPHAQFQNLDSSSSIISGVYQDPVSKKIYVSTGSTFDDPWPGFGLYVSDDLGVTFQHLTSTTPTDRFNASSSERWLATNRLAFGPNGEIFAATSKGLAVSTDGGATWSDQTLPFGENPNTGEVIYVSGVVDDVISTTTGKIIAAAGNSVYIAQSASSEFVKITSPEFPAGASRIVVAASPEDDDYIYAMFIASSPDELEGVYKSTDGGGSWTKVLSPYEGFTPMCSSPTQCQGHYDAALAVDPNDKDIFIIGGVEIWRYDGNLTKIAVEFGEDVPNKDILPNYVHSDKHYIYYSPNFENRVYVCSDGGISRSENGGDTWQGLSKGYVTTQFYSVAHSTENGVLLGGTQDNGTLVVFSDNIYDPRSGFEVLGGDGFDVAISQFSSFYFGTIYYGTLVRGEPNTTAQATIDPGEGQNSGSPFWTVIDLWESLDDSTSKDFFYFSADPTEVAIATSNGINRNYKETVTPVQPAANVLPNSIVVQSGSQILTNAADAGVLTGSGTGSIEFNEDGSFTVDVTFNTAPSENSNIFVTFEVEYEANSLLYIKSENLIANASEHIFEYRLETDLFSGDSIKIQDPVQSLLVKSTDNGVSLYRGVFNITELPIEIPLSDVKIRDNNGNIIAQPTAAKFTKDGTTLFVGMSNGLLYRISGLKDLYSPNDYNQSLVQSFSVGGPVTGIATDPNDPNRIIVTLGGYGAQNRIRYSDNALASAPTFTNVHGDLPPMPVYDAAIDMHNPDTVLIATEFGVWATASITAPSVAWSDENSSETYLPVYTIRQQSLPFAQAHNTGVYYMGTFGRGFWETASLVGINEPYKSNYAFEGHVSDLKIFPNPISSVGNIQFESKASGTAQFAVFDINGRQINSFSERVSQGENQVVLPIGNLRNGSYFVTMEMNGTKKVNKFMVMK